MVVNLDQELVERVKGLKLVFKDRPQPELLIRIPNHNGNTSCDVETVTNEFTSLCPLNTSQPDYATITVRYSPGDWLVELKSQKFYYVSYRQVPIFHESVPALILKDLVGLLNPLYMEVVGQFSTRGGLSTTVRAGYEDPSQTG